MSQRISNQQMTGRAARQILARSSEVARHQQEISSGRRINRPSDDPAGAGRLVGMEQARARLEQFDRNASAAESRLGLEETALTGVIDSLTRLRELAVSAGNGALDANSHRAIQTEVNYHLDALYGFANTRDGNGAYLFSGTNTSTRPFSPDSPDVIYSGSDEVLKLQVGAGQKVDTTHSGAEVFLRIRGGNGQFQTDTDAANTGSGTIDTGSVTDMTTFTYDNYRIVFTSPTSMDIINDTTGATVQSGLTYEDNRVIEFDGRGVVITGKPAAGDVFHVEPSQQKDVFNIVKDFSEALAADPPDDAATAQQRQAFASMLTDIDQSLDHINTVRSQAGSRLKGIDGSREDNAALKLQIAQTRSSIEDLDMAQAITKLESEVFSLEVLQKSYTRIKDLSIFNYL